MAFGLQYSVSFAEALTKDIADDLFASRYLPGQSHSLYIWYVRFRSLMKKESRALPLLRSLNEIQMNGEELRKLHVECKVLYASPDVIVLLSIEANGFYIDSHTKSTTFCASKSYCFFCSCYESGTTSTTRSTNRWSRVLLGSWMRSWKRFWLRECRSINSTWKTGTYSSTSQLI